MDNHDKEKKEESIHDDSEDAMLPTTATLQQQQLLSVGQEWEPMPLASVAGTLSIHSIAVVSKLATASPSSSSLSLTVWKRMHEQDQVRQQVVVQIAQLFVSACLMVSSENNNSHDMQSTTVQQQQQQHEHFLFILPHVSKLLERAMYMDAPSLQEYRNEQTLIQRLLHVKLLCLPPTTTSTTITTVSNINFSLSSLLKWMMDALGTKYGMTNQQQQQASQPIIHPDNSNNNSNNKKEEPASETVSESNSQPAAAQQTTSPSILSVIPHQQAQGTGQQPTSSELQEPQTQPQKPAKLLSPPSAGLLLLSQQVSTISVQSPTSSRKRSPQPPQPTTVIPAQESNEPPPPPKQKKLRVNKPPPPPGPKPTQKMSFQNKKKPPPPPTTSPTSQGATASAVVATMEATLQYHPSPSAEPLQREEQQQQKVRQLILSQNSRRKLTQALFGTLLKESPPSDDPSWNQELYQWTKSVEDECYQSATSHPDYTKRLQWYLRRYRIQCLVNKKPNSIGIDFDNLPDDRKNMVNDIMELLADESQPTRSNPLNVEDCLVKAMAIEERLYVSLSAEPKEQAMDAATLKHRIEQITVELANSSNEEVAMRRILSSQVDNEDTSLSSLADCRKKMIRKIIHLILHGKEPTPPIKDILKKATFLEERLYNSSASMKEYSDVTTLKDRLERLEAGFPATTAAAAAATKPLETLQFDQQSNILKNILIQDADLTALPRSRKKMICDIIQLLVNADKAPTADADYQDMVQRVKFFELQLYEHAKSQQEYEDADTLPGRLKSLTTLLAATNITHATAAAVAAAASNSTNVDNSAIEQDTKFDIDHGDREMMINMLSKLFLQTDGGTGTAKQKRDILAKARYFEKRLYTAAKSKEEYMATDTMKGRLERLANEIAQATIVKRSLANESSTKVKNHPSWQQSHGSASLATNPRLKDAPSSVRKPWTSNPIKAVNRHVQVIDLTLDSPRDNRPSSGNELNQPITSSTSTATTMGRVWTANS